MEWRQAMTLTAKRVNNNIPRDSACRKRLLQRVGSYRTTSRPVGVCGLYEAD